MKTLTYDIQTYNTVKEVYLLMIINQKLWFSLYINKR
jgi:hypothetical protein